MSSFLDAKIKLQNEINELENGATVVDTTLYQVEHEEFHYYIGKKDIAGIYELEKIKSKLSAFNEYLSDTFINCKEKVDKVINETKILDSFYFELLKKVSANFKNKKYGDALDLIDSFKLDIPKSNSISALNAHVIYTNTRFVLLHYVLSEKRNDNSFVENAFNYLINEDYRLLSTNVNEFGPEMCSAYFDTIINKSNTNYDYLEKLICILCFSEKFYNKHIDFFADCYAKILSEVERLIAIYEDKFFKTDASLSECNKLYDLIHTCSLSFAHSVVCFGGTKDDLVKEFYKLNASKMSPEELEKSFVDLLKQIDESDFKINSYTVRDFNTDKMITGAHLFATPVSIICVDKEKSYKIEKYLFDKIGLQRYCILCWALDKEKDVSDDTVSYFVDFAISNKVYANKMSTVAGVYLSEIYYRKERRALNEKVLVKLKDLRLRLFNTPNIYKTALASKNEFISAAFHSLYPKASLDNPGGKLLSEHSEYKLMNKGYRKQYAIECIFVGLLDITIGILPFVLEIKFFNPLVITALSGLFIGTGLIWFINPFKMLYGKNTKHLSVSGYIISILSFSFAAFALYLGATIYNKDSESAKFFVWVLPIAGLLLMGAWSIGVFKGYKHKHTFMLVVRVFATLLVAIALCFIARLF